MPESELYILAYRKTKSCSFTRVEDVHPTSAEPVPPSSNSSFRIAASGSSGTNVLALLRRCASVARHTTVEPCKTLLPAWVHCWTENGVPMMRCSVCHQALHAGLVPHHKAMHLAIGTPTKQTTQHSRQHESSLSHTSSVATVAAMHADVTKPSSIRMLMPKELRRHLVRMIINLMVILKQGRPICDYVFHVKEDTKKGLEYGFRQHATKFVWRIADASELVLNISLKHVLASRVSPASWLMAPNAPGCNTQRWPRFLCEWCAKVRC